MPIPKLYLNKATSHGVGLPLGFRDQFGVHGYGYLHDASQFLVTISSSATIHVALLEYTGAPASEVFYMVLRNVVVYHDIERDVGSRSKSSG